MQSHAMAAIMSTRAAVLLANIKIGLLRLARGAKTVHGRVYFLLGGMKKMSIRTYRGWSFFLFGRTYRIGQRLEHGYGSELLRDRKIHSAIHSSASIVSTKVFRDSLVLKPKYLTLDT